MTENWHVLRSKPRKEWSLLKYVRSQGHQVFYPQIPLNPVNPRARKVGPYFPGYMFIRTDLSEVGETAFRWAPFSLGLVWIGGEPARVAEAFVTELRQRLRGIWEAGGIQPEPFHKGDLVRIVEGAFKDYQAVFDTCLSGPDRVRVLLKMLSDRLVPVELAGSVLEKEKDR